MVAQAHLLLLYLQLYIEIKDVNPKEVSTTKYEINPHIWPPNKTCDKKLMSGDKKKMCPTHLGLRVYDFCVREFSDLFNYDFTKKMEDSLDTVENGTLEWENVCQVTLKSYKDKYDTLNSVSSKEVSNSKKRMLKDDYEAVITRNGPCLIKDKKFPINDVCKVFDIIIKISPYFNPETQN